MKNDFFGLALKTTVNVSSWIAFPVIIGMFLGQWLDRKFDTSPWLFLGTIAVCFFVSIFGLLQMAFKEFKKIESDALEKKQRAGENMTDK